MVFYFLWQCPWQPLIYWDISLTHKGFLRGVGRTHPWDSHPGTRMQPSKPEGPDWLPLMS